jgi:hypothetical protein
MRIINRQPLNFELLTLDDGSKKLACDLADLQQLLGVTALQDTVSDFSQQVLIQTDSLSITQTSTGAGGISGQANTRHRVPTLEDLIHILDSRLPDCYEVVYRKQYASIVSRSALKRTRGAIYVVKQQESLALSVHTKIWLGNIFPCGWVISEYHNSETYNLFIPLESRDEFEIKIREMLEEHQEFEEMKKFSRNFKNFWESPSVSEFDLPCSYNPASGSNRLKYLPVIEGMAQEELVYLLDRDQRFPGTFRFEARSLLGLEFLIDEISGNLRQFLETNGREPTEKKFLPSDVKEPYAMRGSITLPANDEF